MRSFRWVLFVVVAACVGWGCRQRTLPLASSSSAIGAATAVSTTAPAVTSDTVTSYPVTLESDEIAAAGLASEQQNIALNAACAWIPMSDTLADRREDGWGCPVPLGPATALGMQ